MGNTEPIIDRAWWKETVIYQVYPRSFKDSDGDGLGDLQGILSQVEYLASLGVGTVWINPFYQSPDHDNGYDISDFRALALPFGTMEDLEELIARLHEKNMRLIMDMVVNHSSHEHEWFRQACSSRDNPYYDYYHWWPAEKGEPPYRCGFFDPGGKGWHYNPPTDSWYLTYFSAEQPDLNWENPAVRGEMYDIMRFWLKKGVDGFRMDAVTFISKDNSFPPFDPVAFREKYRSDWGHYYADGPHLHEYLREMREVLDEYDAVAIAEAPGIIAGKAIDYVADDRKELNMLCHFEGIMLGYLPGEFKKIDPAGFSMGEFKKIYSCWNDVFSKEGWGAIYLGNHDQPRMVSRWGNDTEEFRKASAKMLLSFLLSMRATPLIYNGDELGMTNIRFERIEDYQDVETRHVFLQIRDKGGDTAAFLKDQQEAARDNSRTPFQWNADDNAGFTTGKPWIAINDNYRFVNRADQEKDPLSILHYTRRLIALRKEHPALVYGDYTLLDSPERIYAYTRILGTDAYVVILNFSKELRDWIYPAGRLNINDLLMNNYEALDMDRAGSGLHLLPYQSLIFRMGPF